VGTVSTEQKQKKCSICQMLHPAEYEQPCNECRESIKSGMRSGNMLDQSWFDMFPTMANKLRAKRYLGATELKGLELFRQSMHRCRQSIDLPGKAGEMTKAEWAGLTREKWQQYKRHVTSRIAVAVEALIESAEV
jgi:hypothetical protein